MTPQDEAAAILTRVFEAICRVNNKTLNARTRADIARACELLSHAGGEYSELLDDLPRMSPAEAASNLVMAAEADPGYRRWKQERER